MAETCQKCVEMILESSQLIQLASEEGLNFSMTKQEYLESIEQGCPICLAIDDQASRYLMFCPANEAFRRPGTRAWDDYPSNVGNDSETIPQTISESSLADRNQLLVRNVHISTLDTENYDIEEIQMTTWSAENRDFFSCRFCVSAEASENLLQIFTHMMLNNQ